MKNKIKHIILENLKELKIYLESQIMTRLSNKFYKALILTVLFSLPAITASAQCPMCKLSAGDSDIRAGLNDGILYLLAAPVILMGGALYFWYRNRSKFENHTNP